MKFDSPDELMREVSGQVERVVGRMNVKTASGESLSANAVRQMQAGGVSAEGTWRSKIMASHQANQEALFRQAPA